MNLENFNYFDINNKLEIRIRNEDIFNNEAMENPGGDEGDGGVGVEVGGKDEVAARFLMPARRGTPGSSESVRFPTPVWNPEYRDRVVNEDEDSMKDTITVKCHKLNGKLFNGTVNFSEAKTKVFQNGLGLDASLLSTVQLNFNKCPVITFKLKSKINVETNLFTMK